MKKHIVFLTEHLSFGGAEMILSEYLQNFDVSKHSASLIIRDDLGEENYILKSVPSHIPVHYLFSREEALYFAGPSTKKGLFKKDRKAEHKIEIEKRFKKLIEKIGPVNLIVDFSPVLLKTSNYFKKLPIVIWIHGSKFHLDKMGLFKYYWRVKNYKKIVVLGQEMKQHIVSLMPSLEKKIEIIPNPFNFERILSMAEDESELTEADKVLINQPFLLSVGRFAKTKDYQTIANAWNLLKEKNIPFKHYIIGDGDHRARVQALIDQHGLQDKVIILGARRNPYVWMKKCIAFVHSAKIEGLPTVIIESMILGKMVIASDCPVGPHEILDGGKYGILFDIGDHERLAKEILALAANNEQRLAFEAKAPDRTVDFHVSRIMPKLYQLIEKSQSL